MAAEVVHTFSSPVRGSDGTSYTVRAYAQPGNNVWVGYLEFTGAGRTLRTNEETSQPNRDAVAYWASGLEAVYLEGALARAR